MDTVNDSWIYPTPACALTKGTELLISIHDKSGKYLSIELVAGEVVLTGDLPSSEAVKIFMCEIGDSIAKSVASRVIAVEKT